MAEARLHIQGMICSLCPLKIEAALARQAGVIRSSVSYAAERAVVYYQEDAAELASIIQTIEALGFLVHPVPEENNG